MPSTTTTPVLMRLEHALIERMDALAKEKGYASRSALAREALKLGLETMESGSKGLTPKFAPSTPSPAPQSTPVDFEQPRAQETLPGASSAAIRTFAYWVLESARRCPSRTQGRVPIPELWDRYARDQRQKGMNYQLFMARLEEARQAGLLVLAGDALLLR